MKFDKAPIEAIDVYLLQVADKLKDVPNAQVSEFLAELRSHILDSISSMNAATPDSATRDALDRLGPPETLAAMYLTENLMEKAETSRSPWLVMRALFSLAVKSTWALAALLISLIGYTIAVGFLVCAIGKPFYPDRDGLWWNTKTHTLVGLGFIWPEPFDRELLGWWITPVGLLVFAVVLFLTTQFARWNIRRVRRFHRASLQAHSTVASQQSPS